METAVDINSFISDSNGLNMNTYSIEDSINASSSTYECGSGQDISINRNNIANEETNSNILSPLKDLIHQMGLSDLEAHELVHKKKKSASNGERVTVYDEVLNNFKRIQHVFTVEDSSNQWIACLMYISYCKIIILKQNYSNLKENLKAIGPSDSNGDDMSANASEENLPVFSLIKLLRICDLNIRSFLQNVKKVIDILKVPNEICHRVNQLEETLNVSHILFSKYRLIFSHLFSCHRDDTLDSNHLNDLFKFGWIFYINIKENYPQLSNDLVNSYHLLLCCINLLYQNIHVSSLIKNSLLNKIILVKHNPNQSLIDYLCKKFDGQSLETKTINEHYFKYQINSLIKQGIFTNSDSQSDTGQIQYAELVDFNKKNELNNLIKSLDRMYTFQLESLNKKEATGKKSNILDYLNFVHSLDIDERIFINNTVNVYQDKSNESDENEAKLNGNVKIIIEEKCDSIGWDCVKAEKQIDKHESKKNLECKIKIPTTLLTLCEIFEEYAIESKFEMKKINEKINGILTGDHCTFIENLIKLNVCGQLRRSFNELENQNEINSTPKKRKNLHEKVSFTKVDNDSELANMNSEFMIDYILEITLIFYYKVLENVLSVEVKRLSPSNLTESINDLMYHATFHKSLFILCFEILFNFSIVKIPEFLILSNQSMTASKKVKLDDLNAVEVNTCSVRAYFSGNSDQYKYPWSLDLLDVSGYDFFRIIEVFIKSTTLTNSNKEMGIEKGILLSRDMIKYLNKLEESILESHAWVNNSPIWNEINDLHISENYLIENTDDKLDNNLQKKVAFPLYDDIGINSNSSVQHSQTTQNSIATSSSSISSHNNLPNSNGNGEIILNLTPNPVTSSVSSNNYSSPVKHPTITRVVCSTGNHGTISSFTDALPSHKTNLEESVSTNGSKINESKKSNSRIDRLNNMNTALEYFFRKFYNLANSRMRELVDGLDLVGRLVECVTRSGTDKVSSSVLTNLSNESNSSTTVTINPTSGSSNSTIPNNQHANECQQIILRTIWNVFEYSICNREDQTAPGLNLNTAYLICDRHLDQLLLCSIYLSCKLCMLEVPFTEIIRVYRSLINTRTNHVYRKVLISQKSQKHSDLILFYNDSFVKLLKSYAIKINELEKVKKHNSLKKSHSTNDLVCLSPVPKLQTPTVLHTHFTSVKLSINDDSNVFVSPGKLRNSTNQFLTPQSYGSRSHSSILSSSNQLFIQPFQQQRNKLSFSFKDSNPNKSIQIINSMIKKNEVKLKPPTNTINKQRLFTEMPVISSTTKTTPRAVDIDETDGVDSKQVGDLNKPKTSHALNNLGNISSNGTKITSFSRPNTNFLSTVVGARLGYMSKSSSNLVTMVINNNPKAISTAPNLPNKITTVAASGSSSLPLGSSFARKLQNIQSERLN